ncbi:MAG: ASKHA domain-containing protein [Oscillospiraceae bacterium]|nr:ASKHA domain-containing protein [Oscillospiraceae bacterium]
MKNGKNGIAIDLGTTTVAVHLVDMERGVKRASTGRANAQAPYGADVTSRIEYCQRNGHEKLTTLIREQIKSMVEELCDIASVRPESIEEIVIAANTVMQHIAAGYSPAKMSTFPYETKSLFGETVRAWDTFPAGKNATIYYTPAISAHVGGDITAGLLAAGFEDVQEPAIFVDIGTNGEIVLKQKNTYYCCGAAAGPAFEGAEIEKGMAAAQGAICSVWKEETAKNDIDIKSAGIKDMDYFVIGGGDPLGICGSGLIDLLAVFLDKGLVGKSGKAKKERLYLSEENEEIYITQADVRKLQLAKAAIAAGIKVMLHYAEVAESEIHRLAIAGGFGSTLDIVNAARVGLIPKRLRPVAKICGNMAGEGAVMALGSAEARKKMESIRERAEYVDLSANAFFNDKFVEQMSF